MTNRKPNFLVIMMDQLRWDHMGCYGNPIVQTPNLDSIAGNGLRFDSFHVSNPICQPNRACLATGQISTVNGCRQNGIPMSLNSVTYAEVLRNEGWRTGIIGKSHFQNVTAIPAPDRKLAGEGKEPADIRTRRDQRDGPEYGLEVKAKWAKDPDRTLPLPYYGFDHVQFCISHGDQIDGHYTRWLRDRHPNPDSLRGPDNALDKPEDRVAQCWQSALPEELHPNRYIAEEACSFLKEQDKDDPFLLVLSFPDPHHPFTPPGRWWDMYDPADMILPDTFHTPLSQRNDLPEAARQAYQMGDADPHSHWPFHVNEEEMRKILALNYGSISFVDHELGKVLQQLRDLDMDDDTVICFMSDHGDYMGDHGTVLKMGLHYQSVIRVPFLWRDTAHNRETGTSDRQASAIDFAPTVLQRAGLKIPLGMQGLDIMNDATPAPPVLVEDPGIAVFADADARSSIVSLVDQGWRISLLEAAPDWGELYDFGSDPNEINNLWDDPKFAAQKSRLLEAFARRQIALRDLSLCATARA